MYTLVPTKVLTRLTINDPLDRILVMTLTPTNGYLLGIKDITISKPGMSYVVTGSKKTLNELLDHIHFVGTEAGSGSVVIAVDDREDNVASVSSTTVTFTIKASIVPSVPSVVLPTNQSVTLGVASEFDAIEVVDTDEKVMEFNITPFGCEISGFKSYLYSLHQGEVRTIYGRPKTINEEIANLKVVALQENAQIGVVLKCGKTSIRQYLKFTVEEESNSGNQQQQEPAAVSFDVEADFDKEAYSGIIGTTELINAVLTGNYNQAFDLKVSVNGVKLTNTDNSIALDGTSGVVSKTLNGTVTQLQDKLENMTLEYAATTGSITLEFNNISVTAQVTAVEE